MAGRSIFHSLSCRCYLRLRLFFLKNISMRFGLVQMALDVHAVLGREFAPAGEYLSFAWPKERHQRKGHPHCLRPSLALREPAVRALGGVWLNSLRSNNASPDPPKAVLLGAYRGGSRGSGSVALCAPSRLGREPGGPAQLPAGDANGVPNLPKKLQAKSASGADRTCASSY
jgi:hypothetical protein